MTDSGSILTFVIVSFCLAIILIMKKDSLPAQMKRYLALLAIVMVSIIVCYSIIT